MDYPPRHYFNVGYIGCLCADPACECACDSDVREIDQCIANCHHGKGHKSRGLEGAGEEVEEAVNGLESDFESESESEEEEEEEEEMVNGFNDLVVSRSENKASFPRSVKKNTAPASIEKKQSLSVYDDVLS